MYILMPLYTKACNIEEKMKEAEVNEENIENVFCNFVVVKFDSKPSS